MDVNNIVTCVQLFMDTIFESSSSSSEDESFHEREDHHRVDNFLETINLYSESDFKKNFRLNKQTAEYLIGEYSNSTFYQLRSYQGGRAQLSPRVEMLSFIWFAANKTTFREVANLFNMSISTLQALVRKVVDFIVETIAKKNIVFPNDNEKPAVAREFEKISGFPNVLGCIDGSYIPIQKPKHKIRSTYVNRHDGLSITLQGICDANLKFLDVYTGVPSKIHDSRVLKLSFISKELPRKCFPNYHLLGDSAYPLREHLLTPYKDCGNLTEAEKLYNTKFCSSWADFKFVYNLIKDDESFNGPRSCQQLPVDVQLIIVLYRLGSSGEGASVAKIASFFGISDGGTLQIISERIFKAILKFKDKYIAWPSAEERKALVSETLHELPHCIGYVDGTEIKLSEKPSEDPEAYFSRKHIYSVKVQAVCDSKLRIRHMMLSWPGSIHDSRIYKNCSLFQKPEDFFSGSEWLAGDKAYSLTSTVLTPFRSNSTDVTAQQRNFFNSTFSKYRVRIEHVFGRIKERFNSLKELKLKVGNEADIKKINRWILVCAILHNIVQENNGFEDYDEENFENDEDEDEAPLGVSSSEGELKRRAILQLMLP